MLGTCVGVGNYKYFVSYAFYSWLISTLVLLLGWPEIHMLR